MRASDWLAIVYFLYLLATAVVRRLRPGAARAFLMTALVPAVALARTEPWLTIHDWIPGIYLLVGYWLPARLARHASLTLERSLQKLDDTMFGAGRASLLLALPRPIAALLEAAYLFCYPLVPLGFIWLWVGATASDVERYWTAVLLAGFACYGMLPWVATRPPRVLQSQQRAASGADAVSPGRLRRINAGILARASVQWNTFPSGHVATATALALAIASVRLREGVVFLAIAIGIAAGSVTGRYHYAADAVAGAAVGIAAFAIANYVVPR